MSTGRKTEAVLDTNVLVSSALSDGKPFEILRLAEQGELISVTSPAIIAELRDVLKRDRLPFSEDQVDELVTKVLSISRVIEPEVDLEVVEDDPDDDKILECAVAGDVDYLVSGDSHLLDLEDYRGIPIYSPDEFLTQFSR
jgi:putative PIN family toxin of toxin-antitoxin system